MRLQIGTASERKVEMNAAVMTSGALCLCGQVPIAQASARASVGGNLRIIVVSQGKLGIRFARGNVIEVVVFTWYLVECGELQRKDLGKKWRADVLWLWVEGVVVIDE